MDYETIRAARLRQPFAPFSVRTKDGNRFLIREDLHIVVSPKVVALYDAGQDCHAILAPSDIEAISYENEPLQPIPDER